MFIFPQTKALIFDIDGTLVDTMPVHYKACQIICNQYGFDFPLDFFYAYAGVPTIKCFEILVEQLKLNLNGAELGRMKEEKYVELIHEVKPMKVVYDIALQYKDKLPMGLGTGSTRDIAAKTLASAGIIGMFDIIITADDVKYHKPAPDTFLLCAERMGIEPEYCQVFEDADPGIKAAKGAGMMVTDVRDYIK